MSQKRKLRRVRRRLQALEGKLDALGCVSLALVLTHPDAARFVEHWENVELDWIDEAFDRSYEVEGDYLEAFHAALADYSRLVHDLRTAMSDPDRPEKPH